MQYKAALCLIICISVVKTLKLSRQRPSTAWGVQRKLFRQNPEGEFFKAADKTYHFEYDTGNTQHQIFRSETRYPDGMVTGFFGYIDPDGTLRITEYLAGRHGYKQRTVLRYPVLVKRH